MGELESICWVEPPHASKQGDHVYRTAQPCAALASVGGLRVVSGSSACARILRFAEIADLVVLCDSTDHRWPSLIQRRRARGLPTVFEINDQFLALQNWNPTADFFRNPAHRALTLEIASLCDGLQFTNQELADRFGMLNDNHRAFWNQLAACSKNLSEPASPVVIGWAGSWGHLRDLEWMLPVLEQVAGAYPDTHFAFMGDPRFQTLWSHWDPSRVRFTPGGDLEAYLGFLSGLTIGIAPLMDTEFNRCRSDVKFLEYASRGVVSILSDLPPYEVPIHTQKVALGFRTRDELRAALERVIVNQEELSTLRQKSHAYVLGERTENQHATVRLEWYRSMLTQKSDVSAQFEQEWQCLHQQNHPVDSFSDGRYLRLELDAADRLILDALLMVQQGDTSGLKKMAVHDAPRLRLILAFAGQNQDWWDVVRTNNDPLAYRKAAEHSMSQKNASEAERFLEAGLKAFPKDTGLEFAMAEFKRRQGRNLEALKICEEILARSRFFYPARDLAALLFIDEGRGSEAMRLLSGDHREPDPSLSGQLMLAELHAHDGNQTEALRIVEDYPGYQHLCGVGEIEWLKALAKYALAANALDKAKNAMEKLKSLLASSAL